MNGFFKFCKINVFSNKGLLQSINGNLFKYDNLYDIDVLTKKIEYIGLEGSKIKQLGGYKEKYLKYKQKYLELKFKYSRYFY